MPLKGNDDDTILKNYKLIQPDLQTVDGGARSSWPACSPSPAS